MNARTRMSGLLFAFTVAVSAYAATVRATTDPCDGWPSTNHGAGATAFCNGDSMTGDGNYIVSPDGNYRLYISAGTLAVYYQSTWAWTLYDGSNGGVYQMVFNYSGFMGSIITGYDRYQTLVYSGWDNNGNAPAHFLRIDNDGCLRWYYSDGIQYSMQRCS